MDKFPMMVYKAPGSTFMHGLSVPLDAETASDEADLAAAKKAGWHETTVAAVEAYEQARATEAAARANANSIDAAPTRAEMEVKAKELGIEFKPDTTDAALLGLIEAKLKA